MRAGRHVFPPGKAIQGQGQHHVPGEHPHIQRVRLRPVEATPAPNTFLGVAALALPDFLIEIEATAVVPY